MKSLPTLIKLGQRRIDALAREIATAQMTLDGLHASKAMVTARAQSEQDMTGQDFQMMAALPAFLIRSRGEVARIEAEIEEAEAAMEHVRARLTEAYREKSKLESLEATLAEREVRERTLKEQSMLDEAALTRRR